MARHDYGELEKKAQGQAEAPRLIQGCDRAWTGRIATKTKMAAADAAAILQALEAEASAA
jgi:hypothetical protein